MAEKTSSKKSVLAPINPPMAKAPPKAAAKSVPAKRGDPQIGQKRKRAARSEQIGRALMAR